MVNHGHTMSPRSHSGYNITRYYLAKKELSSHFFGKVVEAGSHEIALQMILNQTIDAAAIDSTVLETEQNHNPQLKDKLRIIETLGPSPIPPWIIRKEVPRFLRQSLRELLSHMHEDEQGRAILAANRIKKFIVVDDQAYDPLRKMDSVAQRIQL